MSVAEKSSLYAWNPALLCRYIIVSQNNTTATPTYIEDG
jgi:hypothetical protein